MNGEFKELYDEINEYLIKPLKEAQEQWRKTHDKNSTDRWATLQNSLDKMPNEIANKILTMLPCKEHVERMKWHSKIIIGICWAMGVVVILGIVMGVWVNAVAGIVKASITM